MPRGFILHPTYYLEKGRPVVHLFGRLETGETFVVRDDRFRPHFFLCTREIPAALDIAPLNARDTNLTTIDGDPVSRITVAVPSDVPPLRDRLEARGMQTFEADIPFVTSFLLQAGVRGALEIEGEWKAGRLVGRIYQNPVLCPTEWIPELTVLSLDLETDPEITRIYSAALWGEGGGEVLVVRPDTGGEDSPESIALGAGESGDESARIRVCPDEPALLRLLLDRVRALDPDILTGWNVIDFDLKVLQDRLAHHRIPFHLGRADLACRLLLDRSAWGASRAVVPGRAVLDGLALLRSAFVRLEDYRLETAAREILGRGKAPTAGPRTDLSEAEDHGERIQALYRNDLPAFLRYNLTDARLVYDILRERRLVDLVVRQSLVTGLPPERTGASIAAFDFLYLRELHERGAVGPSTRADQPVAPTAGGFVLPARPGIYRQVAVLDYRSLYPSIIRTFRLDPNALVRDRATEAALDLSLLTAPNGARFRRQGGILPEILDRLFPRREQALAQGDPMRATALKILMNSFYGVLATPRCRFYSPETANAITGFGQQILRWTRDALEARGHRVLYGDTDSIFVELSGPEAEAEAEGRRLASDMTQALSARLEEEYGVESRLELRSERVFRRLLLPALRGSTEGSKKRYAGVTIRDGEEQVIYVGLETVRRDWTELSKRFQRLLIERLFREEPLEPAVRDFVAKFRRGEMDDLLVYRKALRKADSAYEGTPPAHVRAARLRPRPGSRVVRYVMTVAGPEPLSGRTHAIDREHYVEKQLRPVAESILALVGLHWEELTGGQTTLPF